MFQNWFRKTKIRIKERGVKDCSTCGFDRMLFEGPGCYRCGYWGHSLNEATEKEKQKCQWYRENPDCTQCSLYHKNWEESWCDYFDVSCAETAVLTHPAATGNFYGNCLHWISKLEKGKLKVNSKANREAAYREVDRVIGKD